MPQTILRARIVLPISGPAIENGAVAISGNRISSVGRWRDLPPAGDAQVVDLGDAILLPGLVNAHCHLDYTGMAGEIPPPRQFVDWLRLITAGKSGLIYSDFAEAWLTGAKMLLASGTTTVGDIEMVPELLPDVWTATPLRVISFLEMTGVKSRRPPPEILEEALTKLASLPPGRSFGGLSPHAPYSTTPELLRLAGETARQKKLRLVTHVSESAEEFEMYVKGRGGMFDWLALSGRDMSDCGLGSPIRALERAGYLVEQLLAVHVNHLAPGDAHLLGRHGVSVVHCPRSHSYFKHADFPLAELTAARVNICLGTDSLASVYKPRKQPVELNLFEEMREFAAKNPSVPPTTILRMATVNGALAVGLGGQAGELRTDTLADLIALSFAGKTAEAVDAVIHHRGKLLASMIDGQWAIAPGESAGQGSASLA
jgi:cytosine/adenosine deaminase-related metal-dependent hydrolase